VDETPSADRSPPAVPNGTPPKLTRNTAAVATDLAPGECREYPEVPGYEILGVLGHGGMGVVYRARQLKANRLVALKMIRSIEHASPTERLRFQIETEAVACLQHPHIVQLYEAGEVRGQPFFSLEFCDGGTLTERLKKQRPSPREAAGLIETLARAMHYAHLRGVVHRDLKPGNVLLAGEERVAKITDFGLAKRIDAEAREVSQSGAIMGTASYMAPEQAAGRVRDTGPAADVYALGALFYECLTGKPPFQGPQHAVLHSVLNDEPVPPSRLGAKVLPDLETICLKCLSKKPDRRYASAEELAVDLRRFLTGEPVLARPVGRAERTWRWCRRSPAVASLLATVALLLIAGTTVSMYFAIQADRRADDAEKSAEQAKKKEAEAQTREKEANEAREATQVMLARNWISPLGLRDGDAMIDAEITALWQVAENRSEQQWYRFLEEALRTAQTTRQLRVRAGPALHAAIGLDPQRRAAVQQLLLQRLRDSTIGEDQRRDVALVAVALENPTPTFAVAVANVLAQAMSKTSNANDLNRLAQAFSAVAARLGPREAARVCAEAATVLAQTMSKTSDFYALRQLVESLSAVAALLEPREAARVGAEAAAVLAQNMSKTRDTSWMFQLTPALATLAARLEPKEAAAVATVLAQAMSKTSEAYVLSQLAQALAVLAARLEPREAARVSAEAAAVLAQNMSKPSDPNSLYQMAHGLTALAARLESKEASVIATVLAQAMSKTSDARNLFALAHALAAVAARLEPKEAARVCAEAAPILAQTLSNAIVSLTRTEGLSAVAARLEPKEAAATATILAQALSKTTNGDNLSALAQALAALAARLEPREAARVSAEAATVLAQNMSKPSDTFALGQLAESLAALAARLEPKEAAITATVLAQAMNKTTNAIDLNWLARALSAVAAQMEPREAARVSAEAATVLVQAMSKTSDAFALNWLASALSAVAKRLEPQEASRISAESATVLVQAMSRTTDANVLRNLAEGLSAVAAQLEPKDAAAVAAILTHGISKTNNYVVDSLVQGLSAALNGCEPPDRSRRAVALTGAIGTLAGTGQHLASLAFLGPAVEPLPCVLSPQQLVDLLKMPTCLGSARRVVLDYLGYGCRRWFRDQWEFVEYARDHLPEIDLTSPPKRPSR
jgi:serine/threonine protein kinase